MRWVWEDPQIPPTVEMWMNSQPVAVPRHQVRPDNNGLLLSVGGLSLGFGGMEARVLDLSPK